MIDCISMDFGSKIHSAANFNYVHIGSPNEFKWFIFPNAIFISVYLESSKLFCCAKPSARAYLAYIVCIYSSIIFQNYSNFVRVFELGPPQRFSHDPSYVLWWSMFFFRKVLKFGSERVASISNILPRVFHYLSKSLELLKWFTRHVETNTLYYLSVPLRFSFTYHKIRKL